MPNTQGGSEPRPGDLRKTLREGKRNEKMLFEAMTKRPKLPAAAAAAPGSIGITQGQANTKTLTGGYVVFSNWAFGEPAWGDGLEPIPLSGTGAGDKFRPTDAGVYSITYEIDGYTEPGATHVMVELNSDYTAFWNYTYTYRQADLPLYIKGGAPSIRRHLDAGPFYLPAYTGTEVEEMVLGCTLVPLNDAGAVVGTDASWWTCRAWLHRIG